MQKIWARSALLNEGWANDVLIEMDTAGTIGAITPGTPAQGYRTAILLPAPANVHSHAFQRAMAGLTEQRGPDPADNFWTWRQLMYRFLDQLTPDHVEAIAALVQLEMLEAGYAASAEFHYLHHQPGGAPYADPAEMAHRVAAAAGTSGIGLTLLPVHYQYGGCDRRKLGPGQVRFGNDFDAFARLHEASRAALSALPGDAVLGTAPHSLRAVAAEDIAHHEQLASSGPLHMHLAEQQAEVDECLAVLDCRPAEWVLANMNLDARHCFIHCTRMQPHETDGLAQSGAVAGLCPSTEANLGDGTFDGVRWFAAGGRIGLGSDSNIRISLAEELRLLDYSQRLRDHSRAALATPEQSTGRRLLEAAAIGGALACGRNAGRIEVGRLADLLALDGAAIDLEGRSGDTAVDCFAFAGDNRMVADVWSAGRHMVKEGRHLHRDAIHQRYRAVRHQLADLL